MDENQVKDQHLFDELDNKRKKRKRKRIISFAIIIVLLAVFLLTSITVLKKQVKQRFASSDREVLSYEVSIGNLNTSVSGKGSLSNVDLENISVPAGVEIEDVVIDANTKVSKGDVVAKVNMASVMNAMSDLQDDLDEIDDQLVSAKYETISNYISSGVAGRVKKIFANPGDDVARCIYDNGSLALLSLDGYMALDIDNSDLAAGTSVIVVRANGQELSGSVEKNINGIATILVSDDGPEYDEAVIVKDINGNELGSSKLYIHSPMRITGISGTVSYIYTRENQYVYSGSTIFVLDNTNYSASYEILLRERSNMENTLLELMEIYRSGALCAPFDGTISSIDYDASTVSSSAETLVATISPDKSMSVTINVDESDILSLELGQSAQISISSLGDDTFTGKVTEINKTASSSSGVTRYSAVVTLDKSADMLAGMTASVVIRISGVDNALLIPVDALHQTSSTSYVYTSYDKENDEFGGIVQVISGISNRSYVEILSGLSEGDTVYYTESQNTFGFGSMSMPAGFGGGEMPSMNFGGGMPSGGNRPSMDFSGGMPSGNFGGMPSGGGRPGNFGG